jgi:hypothetical protein
MITDAQRKISETIKRWEPGAIFATEEHGFSVGFTSRVHPGMVDAVKELGATVSEFTRPNGCATTVIDF